MLPSAGGFTKYYEPAPRALLFAACCPGVASPVRPRRPVRNALSIARPSDATYSVPYRSARSSCHRPDPESRYRQNCSQTAISCKMFGKDRTACARLRFPKSTSQSAPDIKRRVQLWRLASAYQHYNNQIHRRPQKNLQQSHC